MITVSSEYKTAVKQSAKHWKAIFTDGSDQISDIQDLQSIKVYSESTLGGTVLRRAEVQFIGAHNYLDKNCNFSIGITKADDTVEYINHGTFEAVNQGTDKVTKETTVVFYDLMYESLRKYDLAPTYPLTVTQFLQAICTRLGWTLGTTTFPNSDKSIPAELFSAQDLTFRDVLEQVAEVAGSIMYFDTNDQLKLRQASNSVLETLTSENLFSMDVDSEWGPVNSVCLSRTPQEDNIVQKDDTSIAANGLTEIKFENNQIGDAARESYIGNIYDAFHGLWYHPFEARTEGLGYFQIGDRVKLVDMNANEFEVIITGIKLEKVFGLREIIYGKAPVKTSTNYNTAGIIGKRIRKTEIIVDKQNGLIESLNSDMYGETGLVTDVLQTVESISTTIEKIGGTNLLRNSVGLKGTIAEWQVLDVNGSPTDARNVATIVQGSDIQNNTESHSGLLLNNSFITQTAPVISGQKYTLFLRFFKTGTVTVHIGDYSEVLSGSDSQWYVYKHLFIPGTNSITVKIDAGSLATCIVSDAVLKQGDCTNWEPAPNEVFGAGYRLDIDGLQISSTGSPIRSKLDNLQLKVIDQSGGFDRDVMVVSKDRGSITKLTVQDELAIQRYDNSASSLRFIPTTRGALVVINN